MWKNTIVPPIAEKGNGTLIYKGNVSVLRRKKRVSLGLESHQFLPT